MTYEEALMMIDTLRMGYICDPQECGKKDGYDKDHFLCRGCDETYEALAMATEALEKQIPKKPIEYYDGYADGYPVIEFSCPCCGTDVEGTDHHCICGQLIDWSEEDE